MSAINLLQGIPSKLRRHLESRENLPRILANTGWLFLDKIVRMGTALVVGVWLARYLGPAQFGLLNYAAAFVGMFSSIASLGLEGIVVRDMVKDPRTQNEILGTAFFLKLLGGVVTVIVTVSAAFLIRPGETVTHWLIGITAVGTIFQSFDTIDFWFQSKVDSKYPVYARNCAYLLVSGVKIVLILERAPLVAFAWAGLAEIFLGSLGLLIAYRTKNEKISRWRGSTALAIRLLKDSWPLVFSSTFVLINMLVDKIMLGEMAGNAEVGLFSAASRLSEIWYFVPLMVGASVMPVLVKDRVADENMYRRKLQNVYTALTAVALVVAVPTTFLAGFVINTLYGSGYAPAGHMLAVHIWSSVFVFHVSIRTRSLTIEGKQRFIAVMSFFTMVSNIAFNALLIPDFGGIGSSYASLLSWMLCALVVPLFSRETSESVHMFIKSLCFSFPGRPLNDNQRS